MSQPPSPCLWTISTLSAYLQIKPSTLYAWVAQGKIPALHIHGLIRFDPQDIEIWLGQFQVKKKQPKPRRRLSRPPTRDLARLIARAKTPVYTSCHGKPDGQSSPPGKGGSDGAL